MNRRRLEFEPLHDALSGGVAQLDQTIGGPRFPFSAGKHRRAMYAHVDRLEFPSILSTFDVPNPAASSPRPRSTHRPAAGAFLMNGPLCARLLAGDCSHYQPCEDVEMRRRGSSESSPPFSSRKPDVEERALGNGFDRRRLGPTAGLIWSTPYS